MGLKPSNDNEEVVLVGICDGVSVGLMDLMLSFNTRIGGRWRFAHRLSLSLK